MNSFVTRRTDCL